MKVADHTNGVHAVAKFTGCFSRGQAFCLLLLGLLAVAAAPSVAAQTVKFNSPVTFPAGNPFVVTAGDFNGDGKADLMAGDVTSNDLLMLLGNGDGTLKPPVTYHLTSRPFYLTTSDFNRDGKIDIAYGDSPAPAGLSVMLGRGDGTFDAPVTYPVPAGHMIAADLNNDGKPDIVTRLTNTSVAVLINNGDGTFQSAQTYTVPLPIIRVFTTGDFNGDGTVDLFAFGRDMAAIAPTFISVFLGRGDGTFQSPINTNGNWGTSSGPLSIAAGDFDRDGKLDVAITDESLIILKGNGDGTFKTPGAPMRLSNTSADLKTGDFNGDGKLDLVTSGVFATGALQILLGNGDGTFQNLGDQISGRTSVSVVVVDLNGDTRPDLAGNIDGQLAVSLVNVTPGDPDNTAYFVHQHYRDFLDREPDANGFDFWTNQISSCGANPQCIEERRINTSGSFCVSIEFGQTASLVERLYKTAYGDGLGTSTDGGVHQLVVPIVRRNELLMDTEQINQDVVVLRAGWQRVLENNKQSFVSQFVQRGRFVAALPPSMTPAEFVNKLNQNAENVLSPAEQTAMIALFGGAADTGNVSARAQVVRQIAENQNLYNAEFNRAFVLVQYIGYLRRNPDDAPEATRDYTGFDFWLKKLNRFNGNFIDAEMVKAFANSSEYRQRFKP